MLSELDLKILDEIKKSDSLVSIRKLEKDLDKPRSTIHYRLNKMREKGVLQLEENEERKYLLNEEKVHVNNDFIAYKDKEESRPVIVAKEGSDLYNNISDSLAQKNSSEFSGSDTNFKDNKD